MADIKAPALQPQLLKLGEYTRNVWSVTIPPGIPVESVRAPDFWVHCAGVLKQYGKIECRAQDNAWYAELMVRKVESQAVHVWVLNYVDLTAQAAPKTAVTADDYAVTFGGPKHLWRVVRLADKQVIHTGEASEAEAADWLANYISGKVSA